MIIITKNSFFEELKRVAGTLPSEFECIKLFGFSLMQKRYCNLTWEVRFSHIISDIENKRLEYNDFDVEFFSKKKNKTIKCKVKIENILCQIN